jgi:RHS repeat-associated protein
MAVSGAETRAFAYDAAGNLTGDGSNSYTYDDAGRRVSATVNGQSWQYAYNALGQRVMKRSGTGTTLFMYDEQGHLLGEYDGTGRLIQETVWLGDIPVATLKPSASGQGTDIHYVHADHLNTPRRISRPADNMLLWAWDSEPFGNSAPDQNPQGAGTFAYHLRFPGQYFDQETGLHYNYFRDYDPGTGRYIQSDPIGLEGGSMSLYTYADNAPTMNADPLGLFKFHGQWCGPNWTGGFEKPWDRLTTNERQKVKPPEDALDACCEVHDKCHADCRTKFPCDMDQQKRCLESCDRRLYFCSRQSGTRSFSLEDYMRKSSPTPEKGACCPN